MGSFDAGELHHLLVASSAAYGIFWRYNSGESRLEADGYYSNDGKVMHELTRAKLAPGVGAIGRAWALKKPVFVPDTGELGVDECVHVQLVLYNGIRSIVYMPVAKGVVELGSRLTWETLPSLALDLTSGAQLAAARGDFEPSASPLAGICAATGADYAIWWRIFSGINELKVLEWHAPDGACMQEASSFAFTPGVGEVGRNFLKGDPRLVADVQALPIDVFVRQQLCVVHGVRSIAFVPFQNGMVEIGSRLGWTTMPSLSLGAARPADAHGASPDAEQQLVVVPPGADGQPPSPERRTAPSPSELTASGRQRSALPAGERRAANGSAQRSFFEQIAKAGDAAVEAPAPVAAAAVKSVNLTAPSAEPPAAERASRAADDDDASVGRGARGAGTTEDEPVVVALTKAPRLSFSTFSVDAALGVGGDAPTTANAALGRAGVKLPARPTDSAAAATSPLSVAAGVLDVQGEATLTPAADK